MESNKLRDSKLIRDAVSGEKPYSCEYCGKGFVTKKSLRIHIRIHTKEKPYLCAICGKGFTQKYSVTVHMRYHTGERPHKCLRCLKGFVTKTELKHHNCAPIKSEIGWMSLERNICSKLKNQESHFVMSLF